MGQTHLFCKFSEANSHRRHEFKNTHPFAASEGLMWTSLKLLFFFFPYQFPEIYLSICSNWLWTEFRKLERVPRNSKSFFFLRRKKHLSNSSISKAEGYSLWLKDTCCIFIPTAGLSTQATKRSQTPDLLYRAGLRQAMNSCGCCSWENAFSKTFNWKFYAKKVYC